MEPAAGVKSQEGSCTGDEGGGEFSQFSQSVQSVQLTPEITLKQRRTCILCNNVSDLASDAAEQ